MPAGRLRRSTSESPLARVWSAAMEEVLWFAWSYCCCYRSVTTTRQGRIPTFGELSQDQSRSVRQMKRRGRSTYRTHQARENKTSCCCDCGHPCPSRLSLSMTGYGRNGRKGVYSLTLPWLWSGPAALQSKNQKRAGHSIVRRASGSQAAGNPAYLVTVTLLEMPTLFSAS